MSDTIRFDARLGIAGAVLISGKNMIVEDAYKSPLFNASIDSLTGFQTRNILSVSLRNIRREITGVFQVLNKKDGRFSAEDEQLVEALALHAAVALENARAISEIGKPSAEADRGKPDPPQGSGRAILNDGTFWGARPAFSTFAACSKRRRRVLFRCW